MYYKNVPLSRSFSRHALCWFFLVGALLAACLAQAQSNRTLFTYLPSPAEKTPFDLDAAAIELDLPLVEGAVKSFVLELASGESYIATRDGISRRGARDVTWRGKLDTPQLHRVVLTMRKDRLYGRIDTPLGIYLIEPTTSRVHVLRKLNSDAFPNDGEPVPAGPVKADQPLLPDLLTRGGGNEVDVMVLYSPQALAGAGGEAQIELIAQAAVDNTNAAFIDSNMTSRFNLVHTAVTARDEEGGSLLDDLNWVRSDPGVGALRDEVRADMVGLITETGSFCGRGFVMRTPGPNFAGAAFQVTRRSCAVGNLSYAHEHGHNMGFEHDPDNGTDPSFASFPWSFGHFHNGSYRTVMSYSAPCAAGCTRVAHFSNPDVNFAGLPTGVTNERDNARSGDAVNTIVSSFRLRPNCGDGVREDPEQCDGTDLGGAMCSVAGCTVGQPICTASCTLDFSACAGCCNNDGICDADEDEASCPNDCALSPAFMSPIVDLLLSEDSPVELDTDGDGVPDAADNCVLLPNQDQVDSNGDGFGNLCDADLNNDCIVNVTDLGLLRQVFFAADADADFNSDGIVNVVDLGILRNLFFNAPGPSGVPTGC